MFTDETKPRLFLAAATGANIANVPPILELGEPSRGDAVLWLETQAATRARFAAGAEEVLRGRGFADQWKLPVSDEPREAARALESRLGADEKKRFVPVLVGNGGTKLSSQALNAALECAWGGPVANVYQQEQPAELWIMADGILGPLERRPFRRADVTLEDVLACNGNRIKNESAALRFWPDAHDFGDDRYAVDPTLTAEAHDDYEPAKIAEALDDEMRILDRFKPVGHDRAAQWAPDDLRKWRTNFFEKAARVAAAQAENRHDWETIARTHAKDLEAVFNGAEYAADAARKKALKASRTSAAPKIGPRFERAVARRVRGWLCARAPDLPVNEAWLNVEVCKSARPGDIVAEFDVTLVLANGLLLVLECKSFDAEARDLDGRLLRLQQYTTRLSRLSVCAPLYTAFSERRWFRTSHNVGKTARSYMGFVAFTMNGQPDKYPAPDQTGKSIEVQPFEDALNDMIRPYAPAQRQT